MMLLNYIYRKSTGRYKFRKSQEKINHLMYIDDIKLFGENRIRDPYTKNKIYSQDIRMKLGNERYTMFIIKSWKRESTEGI